MDRTFCVVMLRISNMNQEIIERRVGNLKSLHSRPGGFGSPTSKYLVMYLTKRGVALTESELSQIYAGTRPISDYLALQVEEAFELPHGWLSSDHEFFYRMSTEDMTTMRAILGLPTEIRSNLYSLIHSLVRNGVTK
jgi:hypothetical protein